MRIQVRAARDELIGLSQTELLAQPFVMPHARCNGLVHIRTHAAGIFAARPPRRPLWRCASARCCISAT